MGVQKPMRLAMVRCGALKRQHHLTTLCRYLSDQGLAIEFFSLQAPESEVDWFGKQVAGLRAHPLGEWSGRGLDRFLKGGLALRHALKKSDFDLLYVIDSWTLRYLGVATLGAMRWDKKPLVYHTFDMLAPHVAARSDMLLEGHALRSSDLNVNADRSRAVLAKALFGLKDVPIDIPVRVLLDEPMPACDMALRKSLVGNSPHSPRYMVVCPTGLSGDRLSKEIIHAFAHLPPHYHLITIDGGGSYASECRLLVDKLGLRERVSILEPMSYEALQRICACADVGLIFHNAEASLGNFLCHPSRLAYFVAMGLPVVANDVPVMEAVIYRHGLGRCCSANDPEKIASAIEEICTGPLPLADRRQAILTAFRDELHFEASAACLTTALRRLHHPRADGV